MRVLRISHSATVAAWRGRERALRALGADVTLLAAARWNAGGAPVTLAAGEEPQTIPVRTWGTHPALFVYDPRPLWRALGERWDVIDIHEEPFALATAEVRLLRALRRQRAPYVLYTAQNLWKRYPVPFRWLERAALRSAAGVSACNTEAARIAESKGFAGRARVIPLGVDLHEFAPTEPVVDPAAVTVGFVGRLVPEKGIDVLLDAVARTPGLIARIAGAGPLATSLAARARQRGIADRVIHVGMLPPEDLPAFYGSVDVLAVPSVPTPRWTEQFGRVAVEAMASGVPVVSSDAGALPDVVGGAGIVVPHSDAAALADALLEATGPRSAELRAAGFVRAAECTWDAVARDYLDLYAGTQHAAAGPARDLEIIVVAYGAPGMLRLALEPVAGATVTVVDNSSLPEIAAMCEELGVRYIDSGANIGFGAAVNLALADRLAPDADVLLLNPDARVSRDQIATLHTALRAAPDLASVGPAQVDESGRAARVEWPFPSPANALLEAVGLGRLQRGPRFVIGSVILLRAEALAQVGGFDERFFLYAEETDWAYRASRLGWRHAGVPGARAVHSGGGTSSDSARREAHFYASQERYLRKHFGTAGWQLARAANWAGAMVRAFVLPGDEGRRARRRAAVYRLGPVRVEARFTGRSVR
ncbi:glycosyltransferase [Microbacterium sp. cf046]|uniref:glycosyltransferase n=1 Tax=Microbacterium sp. cf046 TaxID=1761803 RepID=UPI0020C88384|nr:glycosyltransferase [Microbacterium sp. cf046]